MRKTRRKSFLPTINYYSATTVNRTIGLYWFNQNFICICLVSSLCETIFTLKNEKLNFLFQRRTNITHNM
jgi:hypothetical protein